jgi:hypothetical protein
MFRQCVRHVSGTFHLAKELDRAYSALSLLPSDIVGGVLVYSPRSAWRSFVRLYSALLGGERAASPAALTGDADADGPVREGRPGRRAHLHGWLFRDGRAAPRPGRLPAGRRRQPIVGNQRPRRGQDGPEQDRGRRTETARRGEGAASARPPERPATEELRDDDGGDRRFQSPAETASRKRRKRRPLAVE